MKTADSPPPTRALPSKDAPKDSSGRSATPVEQALVNRFRAALEAQGQNSQGDASTGLVQDDVESVLSVHERNPDDTADGQSAPDYTGSDGTRDAGDLPTLGLSQQLGPAGATATAVALAATGAPGYNAAVVAQLLEKHVKQMLVSESTPAHDDQVSVMLNLTDAVLPGTQLTLTQTDEGWRLDSQSTSTASYRAIRDLAPQLQERFEERGLGELSLDVSLREAT